MYLRHVSLLPTWIFPPFLPPSPRTQRPKLTSRRPYLTPIVSEHIPLVKNGRIQKQQEQKPVSEVRLRNIHLSYDGKHVLRGLNLEIRRGEATALIGMSGTGKSTALRVITGLVRPDSGHVFLRGKRRVQSIMLDKGNLRVSMVFQNAALFDSLTVGENVAFSLMRQRKLSRERIYELTKLFLRRVGMEEAIDMLPEELSGGMRKRVAVARAIIYDTDDPSSAPDVLLYDEPTAGLDPTASTRIENIIRGLLDVCPTCVVVTHQFSTIRRTADRVVLMHEGAVVWDGSVKELDTTDNAFVRQFMSGSLEGPLYSEDDVL